MIDRTIAHGGRSLKVRLTESLTRLLKKVKADGIRIDAGEASDSDIVHHRLDLLQLSLVERQLKAVL